MKSRTTKEFWKLHDALPRPVQLQAKVVYLRWRQDPFHTSLDFKRISRKLPVYSIRIGRSWRALGRGDEDAVTWFWIGSPLCQGSCPSLDVRLYFSGGRMGR